MQEVATVGVRELRQNLSRYLRRVEAGETLDVMSRGRRVARLAPPPDRADVIARLIADEKPRVISSILAAVEVPRAVERAEPDDAEAARARASAVVGETVLMELTLELAQRAAAISPRELRAADAVHVVSAASLGPELSAF